MIQFSSSRTLAITDPFAVNRSTVNPPFFCLHVKEVVSNRSLGIIAWLSFRHLKVELVISGCSLSNLHL